MIKIKYIQDKIQPNHYDIFIGNYEIGGLHINNNKHLLYLNDKYDLKEFNTFEECERYIIERLTYEI